MKNIILCFLILLCGCSNGNVTSNNTIEKKETIRSSSVEERKMLEDISETTITSNEYTFLYSQTDPYVFIEIQKDELKEIELLTSMNDISNLEIQYISTDKSQGNFVVHSSEMNTYLWECSVENDEITDIKLLGLDDLKDPRELSDLSNEILEIIKTNIVYA